MFEQSVVESIELKRNEILNDLETFHRDHSFQQIPSAKLIVVLDNDPVHFVS